MVIFGRYSRDILDWSFNTNPALIYQGIMAVLLDSCLKIPFKKYHEIEILEIVSIVKRTHYLSVSSELVF